MKKICFAGLGKLKRWCCLEQKSKSIMPWCYPTSITVRLFGKINVHSVWRQKLERVQNYGMRIILSRPLRTHSEDLHKQLNWTTLEARRNMNRSYLVYKCIRSQAPATLSSRFEANKGRTKESMHLCQRGANTNFFKKLIHIQDWNNLTKE